MDFQSILKEKKVLDTEAVERVLMDISENGTPYDEAMSTEGVSKEARREILSSYYGVPAYELTEDIKVSENILAYVPQDSAEHYKMVPLGLENGVLIVGVSDPDNLAIRDVLNFISGKNNLPYKMVVLLHEDIEKALTLYDSLTGEVDQALSSLESDLDAEIAKTGEGEEDEKNDDTHIKEDAPVTKIVATVLRYAVDGNASDIHIEPTGLKILVRFRIDGVLQTSLELPNNVHSAVVARIKILSSMRLDERRKPQDGRFGANIDGRRISFRVSVLPTNHGEKVVMRILDGDKGVKTLEDTGISDYNLAVLRKALKEPYGIVLLSGPTGSGKSTTLYSMLAEVDRVGLNVLSLEDPVEYNIEGVSQSQVRPEIGYTFAEGLRSALRQDPDVIMVGEIRDKETAQLAIQAALTGHLVFSTIHTNNSIGVIPRLIDMGVDPYLIAPTLKVAAAQRLARKLCPGTGKEASIEGSIETMFDREFKTLPEQFHDRIPKSKTILHPEPSPGCSTGTKGRIAITEVFEVDAEIEQLILQNGSEEQMYQVARKKGFMSMKEDAIIKALDHLIPYEEVNKFGLHSDGESYTKNEIIDSDSVPVDNQTQEVKKTVIINSNEDTSR